MWLRGYVKKIDAGFYDDGYGIILGTIRRAKYKSFKSCLVDIDRREGVEALCDLGTKKTTIGEIADKQYVEFNGIDRDERIHIPYILEPCRDSSKRRRR